MHFGLCLVPCVIPITHNSTSRIVPHKKEMPVTRLSANLLTSGRAGGNLFGERIPTDAGTGSWIYDCTLQLSVENWTPARMADYGHVIEYWRNETR